MSSQLLKKRINCMLRPTYKLTCWSSSFKAPQTGVPVMVPGSVAILVILLYDFLSVSCLMKAERSEVWMFISGLCGCLHNSPRPPPIKGVWNGVLSLVHGYTEHRGRLVCKAAHVILSNQARVNTLLWVILQKAWSLNVNLPKSVCLVRTRTPTRWPKVNLHMNL